MLDGLMDAEWYNKQNTNLMANSPRDLNIAGLVEIVQEFTLPLESLGFPTFTLLLLSFMWLQPWASCLPYQSCLTERKSLFSCLLAAAGGQAGTCIHVWRHKKGNLPSQCPFPPAPVHLQIFLSACLQRSGRFIWGHNRLVQSHSWPWLSCCDTGVFGDALCTEQMPKAAQPSQVLHQTQNPWYWLRYI